MKSKTIFFNRERKRQFTLLLSGQEIFFEGVNDNGDILNNFWR